VNLGDIYWVDLPQLSGHEQAGSRPAVIMQDEEYAGQLPVVLVVPLTLATKTLRFPGTCLIEPTSDNGLQGPSVALVFQLRAIDRRRIRDRIGRVDPEVLSQLLTTLDRLLGRTQQ